MTRSAGGGNAMRAADIDGDLPEWPSSPEPLT